MTISIPQLKYTFTNPDLLSEALTHRSFLNETGITRSNERLEFLGDAVLELVVTEFLYKLKSEDPEGILTAARSAIVRTETLAQVARTLKLGEYLMMSHGEEKSGGRHNTGLLANTVEAIIGAIYLDGGIIPSQEFIATHLLPLATEILKGDLKDPKSLLQEKVQSLGFSSPSYELVSHSGPDHDKVFVISATVNGQELAVGEGKNKQTAQQQAAQKALANIDKLAGLKPS